MTELSEIQFNVSPSNDGMRVETSSSGGVCVEFVAWYRDSSHYEAVKFTFKRPLGVRAQSWMTTEAKNGIGILDSEHSDWLAALKSAQLARYPNMPDHFSAVKHFYFGGHDIAVEVLAEECEWATIKKLGDRQ